MKVLIALLFFFTATATAALASDTLTFATHTKPPLSHFLKEILQEALKPYDLQVSVKEMPGRRVIIEVNNGRADGDPCRVNNFKHISNDDDQLY